MESEYLKLLSRENPTVAERYRVKLRMINNVDPFTLNLDYSVDVVPPVTSLDIVVYLTLTHSFYTNQQMKAFKSLQAYKYFDAGFVTKAGTKMVNNLYVFVGKVKHSLRANRKDLDVWCIINKDGSISTAHCTCMAGNAEVCSHVGAILFMAEFLNKKKEEVSCTDVLSKWNIPSTSSQVPNVRVSEVNWGRSSRGISYPGQENIEPLNEEGIVDLLQQFADVGETAVLMRTVEPFASQIARQIASNDFPLVFNIFNENNLNKDYTELIRMSKCLQFQLTEEQIDAIEIATQRQSATVKWYEQKAGRITASKFKLVCNTNKEKPSLTLIKSICYPTKMLFNSKPIMWGITHENVAVKEYQKQMELENHKDFVINDVGLLICKEYQQLAASPDRLVFCECCRGGCLEVKCPYLLHINKIQNLDEYCKLKSCCLEQVNGDYVLKKSHAYYYQVQMQMFVSQLNYCDFVIWSPNLFFKQRIYRDLELWNAKQPILLKFHAEVILPELLGRYFTKGEGMSRIIRWCECEGIDDGRPMINCDDEECAIQWFHFDCVGLVEPPIDCWYCRICRRKSKNQ